MGLIDTVRSWFADDTMLIGMMHLNFDRTDLYDIDLTDAELAETAFHNAQSTHTGNNANVDPNIPIGKQVF